MYERGGAEIRDLREAGVEETKIANLAKNKEPDPVVVSPTP
jgi:hypothetical protein